MSRESRGLGSPEAWAESVFGGCQLGDPRRTRRLVDYVGRQARNPRGSTAQVCRDSSAASEGAYRMLRSDEFKPAKIAESMLQSTAALAAGRPHLLAIEDSTDVSVHHQALADELREEGCPTGFMVHNVLLVDFERTEPLGLIEQERWIRAENRPGKETRRQRPHEEKESARWKRCHAQMVLRVEASERIVTVCDREADIYEFLQYMLNGGHRFVVRASNNRSTTDDSNLWDEATQAQVLATRSIRIAQRGAQRAQNGQKARKARKERQAVLEVRATQVTLRPPQSRKVALAEPIVLNAVYVTETQESAAENTEGPLEWMLLTTEPIDTSEQVERIVRMYECRWLIEEFHKSWKTGCRLEKRPLQSLDAVERMMLILAPIAVRMLQMRSLIDQDDTDPSCETVLERDAWKCLWASTSPGKPLPSSTPDIRWAYFAIARLGGFMDTKRTGRPGWQALWQGWQTLLERLSGWRLAIAAASPDF